MQASNASKQCNSHTWMWTSTKRYEMDMARPRPSLVPRPHPQKGVGSGNETTAARRAIICTYVHVILHVTWASRDGWGAGGRDILVPRPMARRPYRVRAGTRSVRCKSQLKLQATVFVSIYFVVISCETTTDVTMPQSTGK